MFFPLNVVIFLNSSSSTAALVFYLPGVCTHTDTVGKQRNTSLEYFKILRKNTIFNEHPVPNQQGFQELLSFYPNLPQPNPCI